MSDLSATVRGDDCATAWERSVRHLLAHGAYAPSIRGATKECLNLTVVVADPSGGRRVSEHSPRFMAHESFSRQIRSHPRVSHWVAGDSEIDQVDEVVKLLRDDPLTRRAVVGVWDPAKDLVAPNPQGVVALIFTIRSRQLHLTSLFRTTDAWMSNWTLTAMSDLQVQVFDRLVSAGIDTIGEVRLGSYAQFHASFHIYLDDVPHARQLLGEA
jgi:thymidylate synthase